ncbi:hypothetical protein HY745_14070 [Candidatus Desantisbacteria bacterium]|nr:hypothetical protein [Candidatus Desantisbacteria bacterium]
MLLSICYLEKGIKNNNTLLDDVIKELNIYISLKSDDGRGYLFKGILYQNREKNAKAIRLYEKAIQCFGQPPLFNSSATFSPRLCIAAAIAATLSSSTFEGKADASLFVH